MRNILLAILLITLAAPAYAQVGNMKLGNKDSVKLVKTWKRFKKDLKDKNVPDLKLISRKQVCGDLIFQRHDPSTIGSPYSSIDKLLADFFEQVYDILLPHIIEDKYRISVYSSVKDKRMKKKYPTEYGLWFPVNSEPGFDFAFVFVKINGKFLFDGVDQIP